MFLCCNGEKGVFYLDEKRKKRRRAAAYVMKRKTGIQFLILAVLIGVIAAATDGSAWDYMRQGTEAQQSYVKVWQAALAAIFEGRLKNHRLPIES